MTDYEKVYALVDDLLEDYDKDDPDYKAAEPFLNNIKEFYINRYRYSYSDFCDWLAGRNGEILRDFRYAIIVSKYHMNHDDWEEAKEDALLVSDDGNSAVMSW